MPEEVTLTNDNETSKLIINPSETESNSKIKINLGSKIAK